MGRPKGIGTSWASRVSAGAASVGTGSDAGAGDGEGTAAGGGTKGKGASAGGGDAEGDSEAIGDGGVEEVGGCRPTIVFLRGGRCRGAVEGESAPGGLELTGKPTIVFFLGRGERRGILGRSGVRTGGDDVPTWGLDPELGGVG